jgi:hypothetical protein
MLARRSANQHVKLSGVFDVVRMRSCTMLETESTIVLNSWAAVPTRTSSLLGVSGSTCSQFVRVRVWLVPAPFRQHLDFHIAEPYLNRYPPPTDDRSEANEIVLEDGLRESIHPAARFVLVSMGGILVVLLGIAAWLSPSPDGFGTHRQLVVPFLGQGDKGQLPPCSFLVMTGKPCPSCGMTTSWANLMEGRLWASARANVAGMSLGICALVAGPWMLVSGLRGRWWIGLPHERMILFIGLALFALTFGNWVVRLLTW